VGHFYFLLGLGALALLAFILSLTRRFGRRHRLPYVAEQTLFSPGQQAFLSVLERAVGRGYRVYGKVRVADVLGVRRRIGGRSRRRALERLKDRGFDFVVCTAETSAIACAVNLSPRSRLGRLPPRDRLDRICAAARLPFVRFREGDRYSVVEIEERVFGAMHALRVKTMESEPPREETEEVLEHLSAAISSDQGSSQVAGKLRQGIRAMASQVRRAVPAGRRDAGAAPAGPDRTEPVLAPVVSVAAEVDEGPKFRIDGELDLEEHPARLGKG
jgi:hypothetical protein